MLRQQLQQLRKQIVEAQSLKLEESSNFEEKLNSQNQRIQQAT